MERLYAACSGGSTKLPVAALASRLNIMSTKLATLSVAGGSSLGSSHLSPSPSSDSTRLLSLESTVRHLTADHKNLQACISNNLVDIGGVMFDSVNQTTAWVSKYLPSAEYFTFNDVITLLDDLGSIHLSNRDFLEEKYLASRGKFNNEIAARVSASFGRELPIIVGRAESSSGGVPPSSVHPLPAVKSYDAFNAPSTNSGIKQQINDEMLNVVAIITSDIPSRLASLPVALMLANTFLVKTRSHVDSLSLLGLSLFIKSYNRGGAIFG